MNYSDPDTWLIIIVVVSLAVAWAFAFWPQKEEPNVAQQQLDEVRLTHSQHLAEIRERMDLDKQARHLFLASSTTIKAGPRRLTP